MRRALRLPTERAGPRNVTPMTPADAMTRGAVPSRTPGPWSSPSLSCGAPEVSDSEAQVGATNWWGEPPVHRPRFSRAACCAGSDCQLPVHGARNETGPRGYLKFKTRAAH